MHQGQGLRFPCNDQTDEVNKLLLYGPCLAANQSASTIVTIKTTAFKKLCKSTVLP